MKKPTKKPDKPKIAKPATAERLRAGALFYLDRYATSSENLRQVLMRRVYKSASLHGTDTTEGAEFVDAIIKKFLELNILDDDAYARMKIESMRRRGTSSKAIRQKLMMKGIPSDIIDKSLDEFEEETGKHEIHSAIAYIKRRRLGPYRIKAREEFQEKDMAALGRQGFSYDMARKLVLVDDITALEELIYEALI